MDSRCSLPGVMYYIDATITLLQGSPTNCAPEMALSQNYMPSNSFDEKSMPPYMKIILIFLIPPPPTMPWLYVTMLRHHFELLRKVLRKLKYENIMNTSSKDLCTKWFCWKSDVPNKSLSHKRYGLFTYLMYRLKNDKYYKEYYYVVYTPKIFQYSYSIWRHSFSPSALNVLYNKDVYPTSSIVWSTTFYFIVLKRIVHRMINTRWTPSGEWMLDTILCTFY